MVTVKSSLPNFLADYQKSHPDDVFVEEGGIDLNYETTAYYQALEKRNPLIWFKNVGGFADYELVTNVLGSKERMAFALDCRPEELYRRWNKVMSQSSEFTISKGKDAPVKQTVILEDHVDLFNLPVPKHFRDDGSIKGFGRYVSGGLAVARDPLNPKTVNLSYTRMQLIGKRKYAFDMGSRGHLWSYVQSAKKKGKRLNVSILIGPHPLFYMLAASFIENEYSIAAGVLDEDYVEGVMNQDIPIPSQTEIAIEAEVEPSESYEEGPFSEFTGYMSKRTTGNVAYVKSILRKSKPVFYDISGSNSHEHVGLFSMPLDTAISRAVNQFMPPATYKFDWPTSASHFMVFCSISQPEPGLAKAVGLALLGLDPHYSKIAIVNEGDAELTLEKLLVNLSQNMPRRGINIDIIPDVFSIKLDPTSSVEGTNGKMIIVTRNPQENSSNKTQAYSKVVEDDRVLLVSGSSTLVAFSHTPSPDANVNVVLGDDIDLENPDQITWAVSTRLRPDKDVLFNETGSRVTFRATTCDADVPLLPREVIEEVRARLTLRSRTKS